MKFRAFEPPAQDVNVSVMRTEAMPEEDVWVHGDTWVASERGRPIIGRADFTPGDLLDVVSEGYRLSIVPDDHPPRHANIAGWPSPDLKEVRQNLAQQIAAKVKSVPRSTSDD